jgi:2-amino-4-hydroxy-6-hydroxymethyldihydropteridine diphosphokinase
MSPSNQSERPARAFVAFGANLGDPAHAYREAIRSMNALPTTRVLRFSSLYLSAPVGVSDQPDYTNAVLELETALAAPNLLAALLNIERDGKRTRESHHAARTLDLDLLLYDDLIISSPSLCIPHPRMHRRAFVLLPLIEIAPDITIPGYGRAYALLRSVADQAVSRIAPECKPQFALTTTG